MSKRSKRGREEEENGGDKTHTSASSNMEVDPADADHQTPPTVENAVKLEWLNGGVPLHTFVLGPLAKAAVGADDDDVTRGGGGKNAARFHGNKVAVQSGTGADDITDNGSSGTYGIGPGNRAATMQNMNVGSYGSGNLSGLDAERSEPYLSGIRGGHPEIYISGMFTRDVLVDEDDDDNDDVVQQQGTGSNEVTAGSNLVTTTTTTAGEEEGGNRMKESSPSSFPTEETKKSTASATSTLAVKEVYVVVEIQRVMREVIPLSRAKELFPQAVIDFFLHDATLAVPEQDW